MSAKNIHAAVGASIALTRATERSKAIQEECTAILARYEIAKAAICNPATPLEEVSIALGWVREIENRVAELKRESMAELERAAGELATRS